MISALEKPPYGAACNGCGLCCRVEVCGIGKVAFGDVPAPCPALVESHGRAWCSIVVMEPAANSGRPLAEALGIGQGCDSHA